MKIPFKIRLSKEQLFEMVKSNLSKGFDFENLTVEYEDGNDLITLSECMIVLDGEIDLSLLKPQDSYNMRSPFDSIASSAFDGMLRGVHEKE